MSYRSILALTATVLLLLPGALTASSGAEGGDGGTVAVLFDFGDGAWRWADVPVPVPANAWCATVAAADQLGIDLEYSFSAYGVLLESVDGIEPPGDFSKYWTFWNWSGGEWEFSMDGALDVDVGTGSAIAWKFTGWGDPAPDPNPRTRYPWTQFRGGGAFPGHVGSFVPPAGGLFWSADLGNGPIDTTLIVADGMVFGVTAGIVDWNTFTFDSPPTVFALNATTGGVAWRHEFQGKSGFEIGSPAYSGGVLYVAVASGDVMALNGATGDVIWSREVDGAGIMASPTVEEGRVLVGTSGGTLASLHASNGSVDWTASLAGGVYLAAPTVHEGVVYIGTENHTLHAVDLENGSEVWVTEMPGRVRGTPLVHLDTIYTISAIYSGFVATDGFLHAVDLDGSELWNVSVGPTGSSPGLMGRDPWIVVGSSSGLWYIDAGDGEVLWRYQDAGAISASPASDLIHTIVVTNVNDTDNDLHTSVIVLGGSDPVAWSRVLEPHNWALSSVAVADGVAYVATDAGWVYALGDTPFHADFDVEVKGLKVTVTANSTSVGVDNVEHMWSFEGEAGSALGPSVTHEFKKGGTYTIDYWFVDEFDRAMLVTKEVTVKVPPEDSPAFGAYLLLAALVLIAVLASRRV